MEENQPKKIITPATKVITPEFKRPETGSTRTFTPRPAGQGQFNRTGSSEPRKPFDPNRKRTFGSNNPGGKTDSNFRGPRRNPRDARKQDDEMSNLDSAIIEVRRVTRVVRGGKRMRFSALVVVGDKAGRVGYGLKKGMDYQEAVAKATKKAKDSLIKINITDQFSLSFPIQYKYKSASFMLKPATTGTGLIAGGYLRPVLALAGIKNIYSKLIGSRNKIVGVQAAVQALEKYKHV